MTMMVNQTGLQVYTDKQGRAYAAHDAICLEPQSCPNAVNIPADWGGQDIILRPTECYLNEMTLTLISGR